MPVRVSGANGRRALFENGIEDEEFPNPEVF